MTRSKPSRRRAGQWLASTLLMAVVVSVVQLGLPAAASAQDKQPQLPLRDVRFEWEATRRLLYLGVSFRDAIDANIQRKLKRGLPTTIVLTGALYRPGIKAPVATTAQTCKITWHVWQEVYLIELTRPGSHRIERTLTINGVLRRCAEIRSQTTSRLLLAGNSSQLPVGASVYMKAQVQVNPVSPQLLQKIKRWVSRPTGTGTAAPGDALFSTFTGLFLQRIGEAERELIFTTKTVVPTVAPPPDK